MTDAQHRRYLRFWSAAWSVHWCGVRDGGALARPGRPPSALRDQVVALAGQMAGGGPLTSDSLRHACHKLALGRDRSSRNLTNKEQDLVIAIFQRLAADRHELTGQMRSDDRAREIDRRSAAQAQASADPATPVPWDEIRPDADRQRLVYYLDHCGYPEPAIRRIATDRFGTSHWRGLPDAHLMRLVLTVKARLRPPEAPTSAATPTTEEPVPAHA